MGTKTVAVPLYSVVNTMGIDSGHRDLDLWLNENTSFVKDFSLGNTIENVTIHSIQMTPVTLSVLILGMHI